ncbi:MAG: TonB family protein [Bacteroidales bacterium]|jgi:TonB family protein|nr:TonB family protein [Bacteroidales bacterium]
MATPVKYRNGFLGTVIFHGTLLFLLLFMAFRTPLPLPEEQGIMVDFGNSNTGWGNREPSVATPTRPRPQPAAPVPTAQAKEDFLTQEDDEDPIVIPVAKPKETPKPPPKEEPIKIPEETPKEPPKEESKPERAVNTRALYPGRSDNASVASTQGIAGGQGNQGVTTGAPGVHVYGQGGDAGGNTWSLSGRGLQGEKLPLPVYEVNEQGKVVVEITVDKDGNVIDASAGVKGSTTYNQNLLDAAKNAARKAKFTRKAEAPVQKGYITYIFKLQGE